VLCGQVSESALHLFLHCNFAAKDLGMVWCY
jgi:hypothetical protein